VKKTTVSPFFKSDLFCWLRPVEKWPLRNVDYRAFCGELDSLSKLLVSSGVESFAGALSMGDSGCPRRRDRGIFALRLSRSGVYRRPKVNESKEEMKEHIVTLSQENPRYGYRRITALMKRDGHRVNSKRVQRVRRNEGLQVSKRQRKMRRRGQSTSQRQKATHAGHVWSWDFIEDQTVYGKRIRILTIIDEHTRQWLHFHLSCSIRAEDVIMALNEAITKYGAPEHIRSDNGPVPRSVATTKRERQFVAYAVQDGRVR
jgi:putative transposase